nr:50S ribosomal protein L7/L12-like [Ipomoea batatas]GMD53354.1 50S ribosomal protein L7/L12-like [Ipomoea batatas]
MGFSPGGLKGKGGAAKAEEKAEKTVFDLKLEGGFDSGAKIKIIKEVRSFTDLGLKEAKELVEKAPAVLKKGVTKEEAEKIIEKMKGVASTTAKGSVEIWERNMNGIGSVFFAKFGLAFAYDVVLSIIVAFAEKVVTRSIVINFCKFADEFAGKNFRRSADTCSLHFIQHLQLERRWCYGEYTDWHLVVFHSESRSTLTVIEVIKPKFWF